MEKYLLEPLCVSECLWCRLVLSRETEVQRHPACRSAHSEAQGLPSSLWCLFFFKPSSWNLVPSDKSGVKSHTLST